SSATQSMTVTSVYDNATARLLHMSGSGQSLSNDGAGNIIKGFITQDYDDELIALFGQGKITRTATLSFTSNEFGQGVLADFGTFTYTNQDG
ncbi:hypothetical protein SMA49_26635, partial [Escherichia coli]|uniref:hypothetical protein n=1 Tax=Escherichia coli TaxID=562 RepID=UPI00307AFCE7